MKKIFSGAILLLILLFGLSPTFAGSVITPVLVDETLSLGESITINKQVTTPTIPPKLDFLLLVDLSGSYWDDLENIKSIDDGLFDAIRAEVSDSQFAVASFVDYPTAPWGYAVYGDYPFLLDQDFTMDKAVWTGAITSMVTYYGGDEPESQYTGLKSSAEDATWRTDATKVIAITTDASFHVPADTLGTYPGPSRDDTIAALTAQGIKVIAIKAPGAGAQMDDVANATGGSVVTTDSSSSDIADAILEGLGNLPITVVPDVSGCAPLIVDLSPASQTVMSGATASFVETISVPDDMSLAGNSYSCEVVFTDEYGTELGIQSIHITVPPVDDPDEAPTVLCEQSYNTSGKNIPPAGEKSPGQNEDGFYRVYAFDDVDGDNLDIYINGFGPYTNGQTIKITEAPGAKPKELTMGKDKMVHLILGSDAVVTVTDSAGNASSTTCYVPPMPK